MRYFVMYKKTGFTVMEFFLLIASIIIGGSIIGGSFISKNISGEDISYWLLIAVYYIRCVIGYLFILCTIVYFFIRLIDVDTSNFVIFLGFCILIVFFGFFMIPKNIPLSVDIKNQLEQKKMDEEKNKKQLKEENLKRELIDFSKEKIPDLYSAINETSRMKEEIINKKEKLIEVLLKLGMDFKTDEDINRYDDLLIKLNTANIDYDKMLREGYLQYKKFEISSDPAYEKMLENYNNKAKLSLKENVDSFNKMRNQLSEIKNKE